jgi:hypothetical protein
MSTPETIVEAQIQRLLEVVNDYQSEHCQKILEQSRLDARDIVRNAYIKARQRVHQDVLDNRERMKQELAAARAKQHTLDKQQEYMVNQQFLNRAWDLLHRQLERRWRTAAQRQSWARNIFTVATQRLPSGRWTVEHPQDWVQEERTQLVQQILEHTGIAPQLKAVDDFNAGICISFDGATVDGSIKGLTADRNRIEAELLAQCNRLMSYTEQSQAEQKT